MPKKDRGAFARDTDPSTSHEAAEQLNTSWSERQVLVAIAKRPQGATWKELCEILEPLGQPEGHLQRQTISPRFRPLMRHGLIEYRYETTSAVINGVPTTQTKMITRLGWSNRQQGVRFATAAGLALVKLYDDPSGTLTPREQFLISASKK